MFDTGNDGKSPLCEHSYIPDAESWFHICVHIVHFKGFLKPVLLLIKTCFLNNVLHPSFEGSLAHRMFIILSVLGEKPLFQMTSNYRGNPN